MTKIRKTVASASEGLGEIVSRPVFGDEAIRQLCEAAGVHLAPRRVPGLRKRLEEIAREYYWAESSATGGRASTLVSFDAIGDPSITPSQLYQQLRTIGKTTKRFLFGTSRRTRVAQVGNLLARLGRPPVANTCTRAERDAVELCLVRAVTARTDVDRPPRGYQTKLGERPWASTRLDDTIQMLVAYQTTPSDANLENAKLAAGRLDKWAEWSVSLIAELVVKDPKRHDSDKALNNTIKSLEGLFECVFQKNAFAYANGINSPSDNSWIRFLHTSVCCILAPKRAPSPTALLSRWQRLKGCK